MANQPANPIEMIGIWKFPGKKFIYEKEIFLKQTNLMGNTYFANYVEWQGETREKFLLEHPAAGTFLKLNPHILLITYCVYHRYFESTFFGDLVRIELTTKDILKYSAVIVFRYFNARSNAAVGEGWQRICFQDRRTNLCSPVPQLFLDLALPVLENTHTSTS